MTPELSIILSVYNGADYLPDALESLCRQNGLNQIEILAMDDGSSDGSMDILRAYSTKLPLTCLTHERTGNWVTNTNLGLAAAKGQYLCLLHQDDLWMEGRLAWILETIQKEPDCPVLLSAAHFLAPDGRVIGRWRAPFFGKGDRRLDSMDWFAPLLVQNYLAIPAPVFRRDLLQSLPAMDENLKYTADWKLWLKLATHHSAIYRPTPTVGFRIHPTSQTCSLTGDQREYQHQLESVYHEFEPLLPQDRKGNQWRAAARLSIAVNLTLAARYHRMGPPWSMLFTSMLDAGWRGCRLFLRASRVVERLWARIRVLTGYRAKSKE